MSGLNCKNQTVFIGDNSEVMLGLNSGCMDLILADPPFNKEKRFEHVFGAPQKGKRKPGFDDKWDGWLMTPERAEELYLLEKCHPKIKRLCDSALELHSAGMQGYLVMMATRLLECHRLLKETGSIYLHCDPTANSYLRLLLDCIFGVKNFRNEIVWCYNKWTNISNQFQRNTDTILFYAKNAGKMKFNTLRVFSEDKLAKMEKGWITNTVRSAKSKTGRIRQLIVYNRAKAAAKIAEGNYDNLVYAEGKGSAMGNWWQMPHLNSQAKERSGFTTQKPLKLYSRMILASSNPGDVVLDPFCGCATTLVAAENAGRKWIGIDRDEEAERQVVVQLNKLNKGTESETQDELGKDWGRRVIIRKCYGKRKQFPVRTDFGELENYKKHFHELYTKQAGFCAGCDYHYDPKVMHVDHDFPQAKGGQDNMENLQVLCSGCNSSKGMGTLAELREKNRKSGKMKKSDA